MFKASRFIPILSSSLSLRAEGRTSATTPLSKKTIALY